MTRSAVPQCLGGTLRQPQEEEFRDCIRHSSYLDCRNGPDRCVRSGPRAAASGDGIDRKSTRLNSSHLVISYAVFCLKKKKTTMDVTIQEQLILTDRGYS